MSNTKGITIFDGEYRQVVRRLTSKRKEASLSQSQLATALNLNQSDISKIENYERRLDTLEFLKWLQFVDVESYEVVKKQLSN